MPSCRRLSQSVAEAQRPRKKSFILEIHFVGLPGQVNDADFLDDAVPFPYKVQNLRIPHGKIYQHTLDLFFSWLEQPDQAERLLDLAKR